jgi:peptide/nickel transport system permease protein
VRRFIIYLGGRLLGAAITLFTGVIVILFVLKMASGDPALTALGDEATPAAVAAYRAQYHLNDPISSQIFYAMRDLLGGNFGTSMSVARGLPVAGLILDRLPNTAFIGVFALVLAVAISLIVGTIATLRRGRVEDTIVTSAAVIGISMPDFWLSYLLILALALGLAWFPAYGFVPLSESVPQAFLYGSLPALAIAAPMAASFSRFLRATLLETVERDYVLAGRSLGFSERFLFVHFVLRNALIPYVTKVGMQVSYLLGGVVVIERIFGVPGVGSLMVDACFGRDYPLVQGCAFTFIGLVLTTNLVVDLICARLDPRRTY